MRHLNFLFLVFLLSILSQPIVLFAQEDTDILHDWRLYADAPNALYYHFYGEALSLLQDRESKVEALQTQNDWMSYQQSLRKTFDDVIGDFPSKTPLNAKVVRSIEKEGYKIEHIIFESQPGFFVTASLYVPGGGANDAQSPGILYCSGHSPLGYRSDVYQHVIINLVKKGFVVFAFDPVGQGERMQYFNPKTGESDVGGPTKQHSYPGVQQFVIGEDLTQTMVWDGIRAVDYMLSRPEVDPERIGITGRSGGGTQSAQIAAFDARIYASAPENFITKTSRLLQTRGPQDAEQFFAGEISRGLDHPDYLLVRAPKPALMITTSNDMFSIQGTMETEKEVRRAYSALGKEENFSRVEDLAGHASTLKNREAMYAFFQKHLDNPGSPMDLDTEIPTPEELQVTTNGQLANSLESESVFSLNRIKAERLASQLRQARENQADFTANAIEEAKALSGFQRPSAEPESIYAGRIGKSGYVIDKFILKSEGDYPIPFLMLSPETPSGKAVLYLDDKGKNAFHEDSLQFDMLLDKGFTLVLPDLIGTGEMGPVNFSGNSLFDGVSINAWFLAMHVGRSIVGLRAGDVIRIIDFLEDRGHTGITGIARGGMSAELLHAAAFDARIEQIALLEPLLSYWPLVENERYDPKLVYHFVPNGLVAYDLPDLGASLSPRKLWIGQPGQGASLLQVDEVDENHIRSAFIGNDIKTNLNISMGNEEDLWSKLIDYIIE